MSLKIIQNKVEKKYVVLYQMEKQAIISHHNHFNSSGNRALVLLLIKCSILENFQQGNVK